jgi:RNA 2',3'-cyclic 3'-phosphodiesterase
MAVGDVVARRLFFAFDIDEPFRDDLTRLVDELSKRLDPPGGGLKGRVKWVERENFHLTVRFLGFTPESRLTEIRSVLESPFGSRTFELRFDRLGAFPDRGAPRVIWVGASAGATPAAIAQQELEQRLESVGVPLEGRPFRAHLTLGRFREPSRASQARAIHEFAMTPIGPLLVDHITLYESHLSNRGPSYAALMRMALRAARTP